MDILPYGHQWVDGEDVSAVVDVLRGDWLTQGPRVEEFERRTAEYCGVKYAVAVNSGTAALHAAVFAAGVGPGDEVITSPLSFVASANCAVYVGAVPRFADVGKGGFNLDPMDLRHRLTPKTKAVIPVDYSGHPAALDEINSMAHAHDLTVIQDAAHSMGAEYRGRRVGAQSDMTILSFHPVKLMTTGEGGMVLTDNPRFFERLQQFRSHGIVRPSITYGEEKRPWYYEMQDVGFNFRLSDLQSALGISQLKKVDMFIKRRREIAAIYDRAFSALPLARPLSQRPEVKSSRHLYVLQIDFNELGKSRSGVMAELASRGVGSQVHYIPIHLHPYYKRTYGTREGDFPNAEEFYERALTLPLYPKMEDSDVERVVAAVQSVLRHD